MEWNEMDGIQWNETDARATLDGRGITIRPKRFDKPKGSIHADATNERVEAR